ncbi:MAG: ABC transporter ATP-binding protein [Thiotrichales bacterium]
MPLIELRNVGKSYREGELRREILVGVDLLIEPGERLALLGRSGSGKSTLLNLLGGLEAPDSGEILVRGVAMGRLDERARTLLRRREVGFIYQFFNLIPTLTVAENVALPLELNGVEMAEARTRVDAALRAVDLDGRAGSFPDRLSGGEQQRVAIARALVHRPALVLADEPTGNLDATTGRAVLELLDERVREQGATLVLVTHSREVASHADRVLVLDQGRIGAQGAEVAW